MPLRTPSNAHQTAALGPAERTLFYRHKLHRLIEVCEAMAELTLAAAQRDAIDRVPNPTIEPTAALDRIGRCMRRTIMLDRILDNPLRLPRTAPDENRRNGIIEAVADKRPHSDPSRPSNDSLDRERLDTPDFLIDLTKTTPDEVIAEIEADLCIEGDVTIEDLVTPEDLEAAFKRILKACAATAPPDDNTSTDADPDPDADPDDETAEPGDPDDTG